MCPGDLNSIAFEGDFSLWNVSRGTSFFAMFGGASSFNSDLSLWDVSRGRNFDNAFDGATSFNQNLCSWGEHWSVTTEEASFMFRGTQCSQTGNPLNAQVGPFCHACV